MAEIQSKEGPGGHVEERGRVMSIVSKEVGNKICKEYFRKDKEAPFYWKTYEDWRKDANQQYLSYVKWCHDVKIQEERILSFVDYWSQRNAS